MEKTVEMVKSPVIVAMEKELDYYAEEYLSFRGNAKLQGYIEDDFYKLAKGFNAVIRRMYKVDCNTFERVILKYINKRNEEDWE